MKRNHGLLIGLGVITAVLLAGCSASGEGSSSSSPPPPAGGATVKAGGSASSNGLFGTLAGLGVAAALMGLVSAQGRKDQ
jgi:hypothetical protein